jgi:hypothetical protein
MPPVGWTWWDWMLVGIMLMLLGIMFFMGVLQP